MNILLVILGEGQVPWGSNEEKEKVLEARKLLVNILRKTFLIDKI